MRFKISPSVARIRRVARKLAERSAQRTEKYGTSLKPMKRRKYNPRVRNIVAYDLETTRIAAGSPAPLYLTAFGAGYSLSGPLDSLAHLAQVIEAEFLCEEFNGTRFVAWNGNKFDGYIIATALMLLKGFQVIPYLAKGSMLRGFKVQRTDGSKHYWEFLDGIAMTGVTMPLKSRRFPYGTIKDKGFLSVFAPDFDWASGPDWDKEEFDKNNAEHVRYAERDSEGLYAGLMKAQQILMDTFGMPLQTTIGNAGIKIFQGEMPEGVNVWQPSFRAEMAIREHAYRGGYCYLMRKYDGPSYKYDLNQAYASAMRDCDLPGGRCYAVTDYKPGKCGIYRVIAEKSGNPIPFYYKPEPASGVYSADKLTDTWLTSVELEQLFSEGWCIHIIEGVRWEDTFRMTDFVNKLERLRMDAADGPSGALGTMVKSLGNNSYGKTVERLDGSEFRLANAAPEGFSWAIPGDDEDALPFLWYRIKKPLLRPYHQPQIGAFITAHVRMVVRRAALSAPDAFIYADTDCVVFSRSIMLDVHPKIYGKWKVELDGGRAAFITKKVYFMHGDFERAKKAAKGMHVEKLTFDEFVMWFDGSPPSQDQVQRVSFLKVVTGSDMFVSRHKIGQRVAPIVN